MAPVKKPPHDRSATFIKAWRKFRKLSQEAAAERVDVDRTTLLKIEKGQLPYNQDFLEKLAFAYGCEVDELLKVDPLKPDPPRLIYSRLRAASPEDQDRIMRVVEAMLRTGT
jgi:transcriptional regulator with XRE-family HTH domain